MTNSLTPLEKKILHDNKNTFEKKILHESKFSNTFEKKNIA